MLSLTPEQKSVVGCDLAPGEILKVLAFAGTGKTATLAAYAMARPRLRFLYLAFNKSVQTGAVKRFPANVTARTAHALAFRSHGCRHKDRLVPNFRANMVMAALGLERYEDARFAAGTLSNYLVSADPRVSPRHLPYAATRFYEQKNRPMPDLVGLANRLGRLMCDGSDDRIGMPHDGYLKLYQLSRPHLPYDCILLDEAQDINPVISAFVLGQVRSVVGRPAASLVLVGDSHQQIYSFRGAKDSLAAIEAEHTMCLTRSFRFDNNVARVANMVLGTFKKETRPLVGTAVGNGAKPPWDRRHYTLIARTNAVVFARAASLVGACRIGFGGGVGGYRLNAIRDVFYLLSNEKKKIGDAYIRSFDGYRQLKGYAGAVEDIELMGICKVVEAHGSKIPALVKQITEKAVDADCADVVLTTAHKAKGLEWDQVLMAEDYCPLVKDGEPVDPARVDPDEINLIYVAMTRAACRLRFESKSTLPEFIRLTQKRERNIMPST
jgi:F-box DNA helicase 1